MSTFLVYSADHVEPGYLLVTRVNATGVEMTGTGDLCFYDSGDKLIAAFKAGVWKSFMKDQNEEYINTNP